MKNIRLKLNNNEGKTILMALFLLLVAIVVSVVIITAATTAAHQLNDNKEAQQAYLTVSSAAELFRDETEGKKYEHILKTYTKNSEGISDKPSEVNEIRPEGSFRGLLTEISKAIIADNTLNNGSDLYKETVISVNNSSSSYSFEQVKAKIYIQSISANFYNMDISFETAGKNKDEQGYKLNLNLPVTKSEQSISGITEDNNYSVMTTTTTVTFGKGTVTRPGIITDGGTNP